MVFLACALAVETMTMMVEKENIRALTAFHKTSNRELKQRNVDNEACLSTNLHKIAVYFKIKSIRRVTFFIFLRR